MFKMIPPIIMAMLCLIFTGKAQNQSLNDVTKKGLQIGQLVPEVTINQIHNYHANTAKLSDFKGKLVILDFWATWCSPCLAMIPAMEQLQDKFKDKIQILSVAYQNDAEVLPFLKKWHKGKISNLPVVTNDKVLLQFFPHIYLPHYVWIGKDGRVVAITGSDELTEANVRKFIEVKIEKDSLKRKQDFQVAIDERKPFLINGNGGDGSTLTYHSLFTTYNEGIGMGHTITTDSLKGRKYFFKNQSPAKLFRIAFGGRGFETARTIINVKDPDLIRTPATGDFGLWSKMHNLCYELVVPPHLAKHAYPIMQQDMLRYFPQYSISMQKKVMECWALQRTSSADKIKTKGAESKNFFNVLGCKLQNFPIGRLVDQLRIIYQQDTIYPIVDGTSYTGPVDLELEANLRDMVAVNKALLKYDLQFVKGSREIEVVVISDNLEYASK